MRTRYHLTATLLVIAGACATSQSRSNPPRTAVSDGATSTVVTARELSETRGSLLEVLERVRPSILMSRGTALLVSIDGSPPGDIALLKTIPAVTVHEVRLRRASSSVGRAAVSASGEVIVGDVLEVVTRAGLPRSP